MGNTEFFKQAADLDKDFKWSDIFSEMTKDHTEKQKEKILVSGCKSYMPSESTMLKEWQRPFMFFKFGVIGLVFVTLMNFAFNLVPAASILTMLIIVPAFVVPMTVLIFMWEMNVPRNISLLDLSKWVMLAGVLGCFLTFVLRDILKMNVDVAYIGGPIPEEIAKFIVVYFIVKKVDCKYILNGLLIGCAVGAGFSAQESAGYVLNVLIKSNSYETMHYEFITRAITSFGDHSIWAALYGAALVKEKKDEPLKMSHAANGTVIGAFLISVCLHFVWNYPIEQNLGFSNVTLITYAKYGILTIVAWIFAFKWLRQGLVQVIEISNRASASRRSQDAMKNPEVYAARDVMKGLSDSSNGMIAINCVRGALEGQKFEIGAGGKLLFGRDGQAQVKYPQNTKGISGRHCEIICNNGKVALVDKGSTYGTYLVDGRKLEPNIPYEIKNGTVFYLASRENKFEVKM